MVITVEMGEGAVATAPHIIRATGCGSCVILTLYDANTKVGGLAHIMLPGMAALGLSHASDGSKAYQYVNAAVPALLKKMRSIGASRKNIIAKIAGGAAMFPSYSVASSGIGQRNIESVKDALEKEGIPLAGYDTGGNYGRNVEFDVGSGRVVVKGFRRADREI